MINADTFPNATMTDLNARETFFYSTLQLISGLSPKPRFNAGVDINTISGRVDQDRNSSMLKVFKPGTDGNDLHAVAVTSIAPRLRWWPIRKGYNQTIQSSIAIPGLT